MCLSDHSARIAASDDFTECFPNKLKGLPVTARGECIAVPPVRITIVRVPVAGAHPLDQLWGHAISLNGQRVVGIAAVNLVDKAQIGFGIPGQAGSFWEYFDNGLPEALPHGV